MENKGTDFSEEWIKIKKDDIPEGEYIVTNFVQDLEGTKIFLNDGEHNIEVFFDGIPVLVRNTIEGCRMRTWGNVQLKYNDKSFFRKSFFFEAAHARVHPAPASARQPQPTGPLPTIPLLGRPKLDRMVIGLGASTGGTEAALKVLRQLPADIPGMVLVQHMPAGFTKMYADRLNKLCQMQVREAKDGDKVERGTVLVAPADLQIRMQRDGAGNYTVSCKPGEKVSGHRPSVDSLFLSMAQVVRHQMVGIIMTGMGRDGAEGLLAMRKQGAFTIGQDRESSVVYGMPMVAYDIGAVQVQASCDNIASVLLRHLQTM